MPNRHWDPSESNSEDYLITAMVFNQTYKPFRDKYAPGKEMWVTESGDADGTIYVLNGKGGNKRATVMTLNGRELVLGEHWELPDLSGAPVAAGKIELAPLSCTFLVI